MLPHIINHACLSTICTSEYATFYTLLALLHFACPHKRLPEQFRVHFPVFLRLNDHHMDFWLPSWHSASHYQGQLLCCSFYSTKFKDGIDSSAEFDHCTALAKSASWSMQVLLNEIHPLLSAARPRDLSTLTTIYRQDQEALLIEKQLGGRFGANCIAWNRNPWYEKRTDWVWNDSLFVWAGEEHLTQTGTRDSSPPPSPDHHLWKAYTHKQPCWWWLKHQSGVWIYT